MGNSACTLNGGRVLRNVTTNREDDVADDDSSPLNRWGLHPYDMDNEDSVDAYIKEQYVCSKAAGCTR